MNKWYPQKEQLGYALIINNIVFENLIRERTRKGAQNDTDRQKVFWRRSDLMFTSRPIRLVNKCSAF